MHSFLPISTVAALLLGFATPIVSIAAEPPSKAQQTPSEWTPGEPHDVGTELEKGKTLQTVASPDARYTFLKRKEGTDDKLIWTRAYLQTGQSHTLIGAFDTIEDVKWSEDSKTVSFRATQAVNATLTHHLEVQYTPAEKALRSRIVRKEKTELREQKS